MATQRSKTPGLPSHDLNKDIDGYINLPRAEKDIVEQEVTNLDKALIAEATARLAVGEHLFNIREVLEPKGMFTQFLLCCTPFSKATAYRRIDMYTSAKAVLPAPIMQQALLRGTERINTEVVAANPPPKTTNIAVINEYLDSVSKPPTREAEMDPDVLKKECFAKIDSALNRLPNRAKTRAAWLYSLMGMCLSNIGVDAPQTITPVAVPSGYRPAKGRPRLVDVAKAS